jgi:carbamoyl-phosphate synthase large subunit
MVQENSLGISRHRLEEESLEESLKNPTETRIFSVLDAFRLGYSLEQIYKLSFIDKWFLKEFREIIETEKEILDYFQISSPLDGLNKINAESWLKWKKAGFSDIQISAYTLQYSFKKPSSHNPKMSDIYDFSSKVRDARTKKGIKPVAKKIDTSAGEYPTSSNYFYMTYDGMFSDEIVTHSEEKSALVIGCGPYRIGTSVEFDWCGVESSKTMKELGWRRTIVNCNPETVSTDYNSSDILFFEEMSIERLLDILEVNNTNGVIGCMGGQAPNSLALKLASAKIHMFGHSAESIEQAENRSKFSEILDRLKIDQPRWCSASNPNEIKNFINTVGFPVLVRPSYVLSGAAMKVAYDFDSLDRFLATATEVSPSCPVVISEFIMDAKEIEMDGVAQKGKIITSFLSEHIENAGIHSGDATLTYPTQSLSAVETKSFEKIGKQIVEALELNGPFNIQFLLRDNKPMVIECNARASRSFPFISKVSGINLAALATKSILDSKKINRIDRSSLRKKVGVKSAVFSFSRLKGADPISGVEMVSTGEVGCVAETFDEALILSLQSSFLKKPEKGILISSGRDSEKQKFLELMPFLNKLGLTIYATPGTAAHLSSNGHPVISASWPSDPGPQDALSLIQNGKVDLVINVPKNFESKEILNGLEIRHKAIQCGCTLLTNMEKTIAFLEALQKTEKGMSDPVPLLPFS